MMKFVWGNFQYGFYFMSVMMFCIIFNSMYLLCCLWFMKCVSGILSSEFNRLSELHGCNV